MNIIKRIEEKCAEKTYQIAIGAMEKSADDCLFMIWYEPEYPDELLEDDK